MKKIIDIPDEIVQDLKILAVKKNKDLKNFIQDELVKLVRDSKNKENLKK
jgi:phosphopantothenate synthetase